MEIDISTTIEDSVRKLRGIRYLLMNLSYADDLEPDHADMYDLLARNIEEIADDLAPMPETLMKHGL